LAYRRIIGSANSLADGNENIIADELELNSDSSNAKFLRMDEGAGFITSIKLSSSQKLKSNLVLTNQTPDFGR